MDSNKTSFESSRSRLLQKIATVESSNFNAIALEVFRFQARFNPLYGDFLNLLKVDPPKVEEITQIPFLPIRFFKTHQIQTGKWTPEKTFTSSGTTGTETSRHLLRSSSLYFGIAQRGFESFYGPLEDFCILALLPSYLERNNSSLVFMAQYFIEKSKYADSAFYLYEHDQLVEKIKACQEKKIPTLLLGVSFALWDLAEKFQLDYQDLIIMETGGMKGRRKEITRDALHNIFLSSFRVGSIHSEYGMTELISQAYSKGEGIFYPSPSMAIKAREINDPFGGVAYGKTGALNIIDLGNLDSISFIATDDLGKCYEDGSFEVLGRMDHSDLRGCNLLIDKY